MDVSNSIEDDQYITIRNMAQAELRVKKSKFIGLAGCVSTEQDVARFINNAKIAFPGATHYCYAYVIDVESKTLIRSNDAGEPINSAGKPILSAVESSGFRNVICVVVRYFGGIKLGIGGLIRAYGQTARDCLSNAESVVRVPYVNIQIEIPYAHIGAVVKLINRLRAKILSMDHNEKSVAVVHIRRSLIPSLEENIKAIGKGILTSISK